MYHYRGYYNTVQWEAVCSCTVHIHVHFVKVVGDESCIHLDSARHALLAWQLLPVEYRQCGLREDSEKILFLTGEWSNVQCRPLWYAEALELCHSWCIPDMDLQHHHRTEKWQGFPHQVVVTNVQLHVLQQKEPWQMTYRLILFISKGCQNTTVIAWSLKESRPREQSVRSPPSELVDRPTRERFVLRNIA